MPTKYLIDMATIKNQIFQYNGSPISFQKGDSVMVNATEMAKSFGKTTKDWLRTKQSKDFINSLSAVRQISLTELVMILQGGNGEQGTWMHEDVAIEFARWLNPAFAIWCNDRIKELLTVGMTATQPTLEQMIDNPDLVIKLATELKQKREEVSRLQMYSEQQQATIELQEEQLKKSASKVAYHDKVLSSVSTYTATQIAKEFGFGAETLNKKLREMNVQYKQNGQWLLKSKYQNKGYTKTITRQFTGSNGETHTSQLTVWTEAGREFIHGLLDKKSK